MAISPQTASTDRRRLSRFHVDSNSRRATAAVAASRSTYVANSLFNGTLPAKVIATTVVHAANAAPRSILVVRPADRFAPSAQAIEGTHPKKKSANVALRIVALIPWKLRTYVMSSTWARPSTTDAE